MTTTTPTLVPKPKHSQVFLADTPVDTPVIAPPEPEAPPKASCRRKSSTSFVPDSTMAVDPPMSTSTPMTSDSDSKLPQKMQRLKWHSNAAHIGCKVLILHLATAIQMKAPIVVEQPTAMTQAVETPAMTQAVETPAVMAPTTQDDSNLDSDFFMSQKLATAHKGKACAQSTTPAPQADWTIFKEEDPVYYNSHLQPFVHILELETLIVGYQVLASLFGRCSNYAKRELIREAAEHLLKRDGVDVLPLTNETPWVLINLKDSAERTILLDVKVIGSSSHQTLVFF